MRSTLTTPQDTQVHGGNFLRYLRRSPRFALRVAVDCIRLCSERRTAGGARDSCDVLVSTALAVAGRAEGVSSSGGSVRDSSIVFQVPGRQVCALLLGRQNRRRATESCEGLVEERRPVLVRLRTRTPRGEFPNIHLALRGARALRIPKRWTSQYLLRLAHARFT